MGLPFLCPEILRIPLAHFFRILKIAAIGAVAASLPQVRDWRPTHHSRAPLVSSVGGTQRIGAELAFDIAEIIEICRT